MTNITVEFFDFEAEKDGLDMDFGLTIDFTPITVQTYDNDNTLNSTQIPSATFWLSVFTDKNIPSGGYRIFFNAGEFTHLFIPLPPPEIGQGIIMFVTHQAK